MLTAEQKARLETLNSQLNSGKLTDAEISEWGGLYTHRDDSPHSAFRDAVYAARCAREASGKTADANANANAAADASPGVQSPNLRCEKHCYRIG